MTDYLLIVERLRRVAEDLSQAQHPVDLQLPEQTLREIADEIEQDHRLTGRSPIQGHGTD